MPSTHITIAQTLAAAATPHSPDPESPARLAHQTSTAAPAGQPGAAVISQTKLTPSMRRMILDEHKRGDWFASARGDNRALANARATFAAMQHRGLIGPDQKPTLAAIQAALS
jgi:hypothetical protein